MVSVDFFTVPTIRFEILYVFLVLAHERRRIVHFAVTAHPTAEWTAQQLREAFPWDSAPRYLLRDRARFAASVWITSSSSASALSSCSQFVCFLLPQLAHPSVARQRRPAIPTNAGLRRR
jgi:hypothetical protein